MFLLIELSINWINCSKLYVSSNKHNQSIIGVTCDYKLQGDDDEKIEVIIEIILSVTTVNSDVLLHRDAHVS